MARNYQCDQCGACCRMLIIEIQELDIIREPRLAVVARPVKIPPGQKLVDEDGEPYEEVVPGFGGGALLSCGPDHSCPMLDTDNRCTIYPTRPNVCVGMQAGSEQCQISRETAGLPRLEPIATVATDGAA